MVIKFYGGVNEIGGNRILIEDRKTRLFLDQGMSFLGHQKFFEEYLKPRYSSTGFKDLLRLHLLHDLPGLYRRDLLALLGKPVHESPSVDGLFLSHIHLDHSALISVLDERIPVICSELTRAYAKTLLEVGTRGLETEFVNFKPRPLIDVREEPVERVITPFVSGKDFRVGSITITPQRVDHSVVGAAGCIIRTSDATIVYTGDLRLHGKLGQHTEEFIEAAAKSAPDIMLCEGTRIDEDSSTSEDYVFQNAVPTIQKADGLVIADFAFRDFTRLTTFFEVAKATGRKLVLSKRDIRMIEALAACPDMPFKLPSVDDDSVAVYIERKGTGTYRERDYDKWERPYLTLPNAVHADQVREERKQLIVHLTFFDINELVDINPPPGTAYIHSASEPHHEEQRIDEKRLNNWLDYFGVAKFHYHASGHASGADIRGMVERIRPKTLIPIHTEHPELFPKFHSNVKMPALEPY